MFRRNGLFLCLCFLFIFSFSFTTVHATSGAESIDSKTAEEPVTVEISGEESGWVRFSCRVPEGFPGTVNVIIYEVEEQEEIRFFLREDTGYSILEPLKPGSYKIAAVSVSGGAEGCFEIGYSSEAFTVLSGDNEAVEVPIYLGIAQEMQGTDDNKFAGMTYAEVMAAVKGNSTVESSSAETSAEEILSEQEPVIEAVTEEEYFQKVEEYAEEQSMKKEKVLEKEQEKNSFLFSFGIMLLFLLGIGIAFYFFKKNREL